VGFHDLIRAIQGSSANSGGVSTVVWQTFVHLLEEVEGTEYRMRMNAMGDVHKDHTDRMVAEHAEETEKWHQQENELEETIASRDRLLDEVRDMHAGDTSRRDALQRELEECVEQQKREISLLTEERDMANSKCEDLEDTVEEMGDELTDLKDDLRVERESVLRLTTENQELHANGVAPSGASPGAASGGVSFAPPPMDAGRSNSTIAMSNVSDRRRSSAITGASKRGSVHNKRGSTRASMARGSTARGSMARGSRNSSVSSNASRKSMSNGSSRGSVGGNRSRGNSILSQLHESGGGALSQDSNIFRRLSSKLSSSQPKSPVSAFMEEASPLAPHSEDPGSPLTAPRIIVSAPTPPPKDRSGSFASSGGSRPSTGEEDRSRIASVR
jgi:hypothetical protein